MKTYQQVGGTFFDVRTPTEVIKVLESARQNRSRLHISIGDVESGLDWLDEFTSYGYIGRSMGPIKIPLLIANGRSTGGPGLLDHCIVRIRTSAGGRVLYQHPKYHYGSLEIRRKSEPLRLDDGRVLTVDVLRDGTLHAAFENMEKARRWASKLGVVAPIAA